MLVPALSRAPSVFAPPAAAGAPGKSGGASPPFSPEPLFYWSAANGISGGQIAPDVGGVPLTTSGGSACTVTPGASPRGGPQIEVPASADASTLRTATGAPNAAMRAIGFWVGIRSTQSFAAVMSNSDGGAGDGNTISFWAEQGSGGRLNMTGRGSVVANFANGQKRFIIANLSATTDAWSVSVDGGAFSAPQGGVNARNDGSPRLWFGSAASGLNALNGPISDPVIWGKNLTDQEAADAYAWILTKPFATPGSTLANEMTVNGTTVQPLWAYRGEDCTSAALWPSAFGVDLPTASTGANPTLGAPGPTFMPAMKGVTFTATGKVFAGGSVGPQFGTIDGCIEVLFRAGTTGQVCGNRNTTGWCLQQQTSTSARFICTEMTGGGQFVPTFTTVAGNLYLAHVFFDRDQGASSGRLFVNKVAGTVGTFPTNALDSAAVPSFGSAPGSLSKTDCTLIRAAGYSQASWFAGATNAADMLAAHSARYDAMFGP